MDEDVLERDGRELEPEGARVGASLVVERPDRGDRPRRAEALVADHLEVGRVPVDHLRRSGDGHAPRPQVIRALVQQDASVVDDQHVLEQATDLLDQVGGQQDRPGLLEVVLEQQVVEDVPRRGVEAEGDLVEHRQRRAAGQTERDADRGPLSAGQRVDRTVAWDVERVEDAVRVRRVEPDAQRGGEGQGVGDRPGPDHVGGLADEARGGGRHRILEDGASVDEHLT